MTFRRYMRKNHATQEFTNLLFWDTETYDTGQSGDPKKQTHKLMLGVGRSLRRVKGTNTRRKILRYKSNEEFWQWLVEHLDPKRPLYAFAHNIGFDLTISGFWKLIENGMFELSWKGKRKDRDTGKIEDVTIPGIFCDEDPPTIIKVRHAESGCLVTFVDSLNYYRSSLEQIGRNLDLPKLPMPDAEASEREWYDYCERDVLVLETAITNLMTWFRDNDYGNFKFTQASLAMTAFRHRFMTHYITLDKSSLTDELEADSYYGGRLECFRLGTIEGTTSQLDVVSQYPSVMAPNSFPVDCIATSQSAMKPLPVDKLTIGHIAEVRLKTDVSRFPLRVKDMGTLYPVGEFITTLAGPELLYAKKLGCVAEVYRWSQYNLLPIFRDFVNHFFNKRLEAREKGDEEEAYFLKILLNSLYGKFGQKTAAWHDMSSDNTLPQWMQNAIDDEQYQEHIANFDTLAPKYFIWKRGSETGTVKYRTIGSHCQIQQAKEPHKNSFCGIAAFVTSYARVMIDKLITIAGREECYYVVTDAIFCSDEGVRRLRSRGKIGNGTLGSLTIDATGDNFRLDAIHHYRLGEKIKRGSRRAGGRVICPNCDFAIDDFCRVCSACGKAVTGLVTIETQFDGIRGVLRRADRSYVGINERRKNWRREYNRGTTSECGRVNPIAYKVVNGKNVQIIPIEEPNS